MKNNIPYMRKETSTLLVFSAAILMLLLASPLLLSNVLLQPAQAQTLMSFRTPTPASNAIGADNCFLTTDVTLTFDAQGTTSSSSPYRLEGTSGTFEVTDSKSETRTYSGSLTGGVYTNNSGGGGEHLELSGMVNYVSKAANCPEIKGSLYAISTPCSTSNDGGTLSSVNILILDALSNTFKGVVECSPSQGGENATTTAQPSSTSATTGTTTAQDSDGDGIPDSSDKCPHNSEHRCFKEGEASTTTTSTSTNQQQQPSSNRTGNQTR